MTILAKFIYDHSKVYKNVKCGGIIQEPELSQLTRDPNWSYHHKGIGAWFDNPASRGFLRGFLRSFNLNDADFDDLFQEVHLKAYESSPDFKKRSKPVTWICQIAWYKALDLARKHKRTKDKEVNIHQTTDYHMYHSGIFVKSSEKAYEENERLELLLRAIDQLPKEKREFIILRASGMPYNEIAAYQGVSDGTVVSRLQEGRAVLRSTLKNVRLNRLSKEEYSQKPEHSLDTRLELQTRESKVFKNRKYNGDPLSYFQKHAILYAGLSRNQLNEVDSGLYDALRRNGQLELAIPEADRKQVDNGRKLGQLRNQYKSGIDQLVAA